jgi:hypothetical protein
MTIHEVSKPMDRRRQGAPTIEDLRNGAMPTIVRVEDQLKENYKEYDSRARDPETTLVGFKLHRHILNVKNIVVAMGVVRGRFLELDLRASIAIFHDNSKMLEEFSLHLLNRKLTKQELKIMSRHAKVAARAVREIERNVPHEDRLYFRLVYIGVRWHHKPWCILEDWLRQLVWDQMVADAFDAFMDDREEPGLEESEALESLTPWSERKIPRRIREKFGHEIQSSIDTLKQVCAERKKNELD